MFPMEKSGTVTLPRRERLGTVPTLTAFFSQWIRSSGFYTKIQPRPWAHEVESKEQGGTKLDISYF